MTAPDRPEDGATTSLFVENVDTWEPQSAEDRRLLGDLDAELVRDALVLPIITTGEGRLAGGVVRPDGSRVERGRHLQHAEQVDHPANVVDVYSPAEAPVRHHGRVIYAGGGGKFGAFGHFLIEDLSRLWCLFENPEYRDLPLVFINPQQKIDSAGFRLLELAGISAEQVLILDRPTVFDEVIVPDQSLFLHPGSLHAAKSRITYDAIRDSVAPGPYEKVYFTYTQMKRTQLSVSVNEEMIEDLYRRNGFEIIAPETLSIREQIGIIAGAREIACTAGTLSHLVAFARDGVVLDIFVRDKNFMPEIQWSLDQLRSAQVSVVDTLRPLLWGNARRGVIYFTPTPQWARFARARFDAIEPSESPDDYVAKYLAEWAQLLGNSRKWALDLMPEWRASDLVESLYLALLPAEELSARLSEPDYGVGSMHLSVVSSRPSDGSWNCASGFTPPRSGSITLNRHRPRMRLRTTG